MKFQRETINAKMILTLKGNTVSPKDMATAASQAEMTINTLDPLKIECDDGRSITAHIRLHMEGIRRR